MTAAEIVGCLAGAEVNDPDAKLLAPLRAGDQRAFAEIVDRWSPVMLAIARAYVPGHQAAEDVVQDAWLAVIRGLAGFEGRSTLRMWVFAILVDGARRRASIEARSLTCAQVVRNDAYLPTVDPGRFQGREHEHPGHWTSAGAPTRWEGQPEGRALAGEAVALLGNALDALPPRQRLVVELRDVQGLSGAETCEVLDITAENQRVLLHHGRASLRRALEDSTGVDRSTPNWSSPD